MSIRFRKIIVVASVFVALLLGIVVIQPSKEFPAGQPGPTIEFEVQAGANGSEIASNLAKRAVIKKASEFYALAVKDPRSRSIAPGVHQIETHIPSASALNQLLDTSRLLGVIVVKDGSTLADVLLELKKSPVVKQIDGQVPSSPALKYLDNPTGSLEGLLFPAHYSFTKGTSVISALGAMMTRFAYVASDLQLSQGFRKYTPYQVLIIASMAQIEGDPSDFSKVVRVILNRLDRGMPLQLNSTVQYAANLRGQIQLSTKAIQINSPYNTYKFVGLPPTPISNPSLKALEAALHPANGDWLYFITVKPGDTRFTDSYQQFSQWENLYHQNLSAGAFK